MQDVPNMTGKPDVLKGKAPIEGKPEGRPLLGPFVILTTGVLLIAGIMWVAIKNDEITNKTHRRNREPAGEADASG